MDEPHDLDKRRAVARRTAWALGIGAALVYAMFILSGVVGH